MSFIVVKKVTPKETETFNSIDDWKEVHGPYHGTKAGIVLRSNFKLDKDGKSAIIKIVYESEVVFDRHMLRMPEEYYDEFDVEIISKERKSLD